MSVLILFFVNLRRELVNQADRVSAEMLLARKRHTQTGVKCADPENAKHPALQSPELAPPTLLGNELVHENGAALPGAERAAQSSQSPQQQRQQQPQPTQRSSPVPAQQQTAASSSRSPDLQP